MTPSSGTLDTRGVIVRNEDWKSGQLQCLGAFLKLHQTMTGYPEIEASQFLKDGTCDLSLIFQKLYPHGQFMIEGVDEARDLTLTHIRGHTDALAITVDPSIDPEVLSLALVLIDEGQRIILMGRESSVRNLIKATSWKVAATKGHTWASGTKMESWKTDTGLKLRMDAKKSAHYSEVIRQRDKFLTFPWSL